MARKDRTVYRTPERQAQRGVKASAGACGWSWVTVEDGTRALYANAGLSRHHVQPNGWSPPPRKHGERPRAHYITLSQGIIAFRCLECGQTEHSLICHEYQAKIPPRPMLCVACKESAEAEIGLAVQRLMAVFLGWTQTEPTPFMGDGSAERLQVYRERAKIVSVRETQCFAIRRDRKVKRPENDDDPAFDGK